jgi:hypothetical protein
MQQLRAGGEMGHAVNSKFMHGVLQMRQLLPGNFLKQQGSVTRL